MSGNIEVFNLSAYTTPEIIEHRNKEWIEYGSDNNYFNYLIDRFTKSATNNAIITGIAKMIYGKGLSATNSSRKPEAYAKMLTLFRKNDLRRFAMDRKLLGMAAFQLTYDKGEVVKVSHFPMETLRAEKCNKDGEIEAWYYHPDWINKKPSEEPTRIAAFGYGKGKNELYVLKPYVSGYYYYSPVDYQGALPYSVLEEEIGDYLINDTINGFSGTKVVNFNNGVPDEEKREQIKRDVLNKLTGTKGEKVIIAFNANAESKTSVEDLPLNDAPDHYAYLSEECVKKLIVGHRVTSPMLIGLRDGGNSLGNNADEIRTATLLFDNVVINSYQEEITDVIDEILAINNISLNTYFKTLEPLEFVDTDGLNKEAAEEETGVKMGKDFTDSDGNDLLLNEALDTLGGEVMNVEEFEIVDIRDVSDDNMSVEDWADNMIQLAESVKSDTPVKNNPNGFSTLDKSYYKVRYKYNTASAKGKGGKSRKFCKEMMSRSKRGVVYRLEDIDKASRQMNFKAAELPMHKGQSYDLFKYKGGVYCRHKWQQVLYRMKVDAFLDGKKGSKDLKDYDVVKEIPKSYEAKPRGHKSAKKAPRNMPNNGHHPDYKK